MWNRIGILAGVRLGALWRTAFVQVAPLWLHAVLATGFAALVRADLGPQAFATALLALSALLVTMPLVGELGLVLRTDPAREWVEALPLRTIEARLARTVVLLSALGALALASLLPAALLAPKDVGWSYRPLLVLAGLAQTLAIAGPVLVLQGLLRGPARGLLVLAQTGMVTLGVVGALIGLRHVAGLRVLDEPWRALPRAPMAWFATWTGALDDPIARTAALLAAGLFAFAIAVLLLAPPPAESEPPRGGSGLLERALAGPRALVARMLVRADERAAYDLVFDALPREREFALRTYPLLGIPIAFLLLGAAGGGGDLERSALLALLLFVPVVLFPVLLVHVPATATPEASWLLETAPVSERAVAAGARKAVAVRFLLPLFVALFALALSREGLEFTLRLWPPALAVNLLVLRLLWPRCVVATPLSQAPDELQTPGDLGGTLLGLAFALTLLAAAAHALIPSPLVGIALAVGVLGLDALLARSSPAHP